MSKGSTAIQQDLKTLQPGDYVSPRADIDALNIAYTAASQVQERAAKLKKELYRVRMARSQ